MLAMPMSSMDGVSTTSGSGATGGRAVWLTVCFFFVASPAGFRGSFGRARDASIDFTRSTRGAEVGGVATAAGGAGGATAAEAPVTRCVPARFLFLIMVEPDGAAGVAGAVDDDAGATI
jgi:hypothetical protein